MTGFFKESEPVMMNTVTLNEENVNSFHHAISSVVVTAQCFGLLPVLGITGPNATSVRFRWCSFRTVFSIFILLGTGLNMCFSIVLMRSGVSFKESDGMAFFGTVTITYMLFLQLARQWPTLISEWENLEISQKHYGYPRRLCLKIKIMTVIVLTGALVEHALSKASGIMTAVACTDNITDVFRYYFTRTGTYDQMFAVMEYSFTTAILTLITNFIATFTWNFTDLFIILMSLALTERFRLFNQNLDSVRGKLLTESFWSQIREEYNSLSHLTRTLDSCISKIVLVSFASNLYFICRQLLSSLSPLHGLVNTVYFCWSFGFVLFRAVTLSVYASRIYDESLLPKRVLYDVPPESYKVEVSRFLNQIVTDTVALSGMNFFYITRTLLLTLAGTIVTYEIVLVQLNSISLVGSNTSTNVTEKCYD
uniref:Gustatory receptor n=1 Tax=Reticulitermes speratus TaxID=60591 RepID=A0A0U5AXB0_9NEOP